LLRRGCTASPPSPSSSLSSTLTSTCALLRRFRFGAATPSPASASSSSLTSAAADRGDLQLALDYYRKAEQYVPENAKLKERCVTGV
jgi:hypothetical protein